MNLEIIIVNYNLKEQTNILLNQLINQTFKDFSIILIDQASTEEGTDLFLDNWSNKIKVIKNQTNVPLNHLWNEFVKNSDSDLITLINNDIEIPKNYVKDTLETFKFQPDIVCAIHATNNPKYSEVKNKLEYVLKEKYDIKQGWEFTIKKDWLNDKPIPKNLNLYCGDDFIFNRIYEEKRKIAIITSSPIVHHCSLTEKKYDDVKLKNKMLFDADKDNFLKLGFKHFLRNDFEFSKLHKPLNMALIEEENKGKISCIMPVYLGKYPHCSKNREDKFIRAVNSFLSQTYKKSELIIISDDCEAAEKIYLEKYSNQKDIIFSKITGRTKAFSGSPRNKGLSLASGEFITYLDSDDFILPTHFENIVNEISQYVDWVYYNDNVIKEIESIHAVETAKYEVRDVRPRESSIGTSSITHKSYVKLEWGDGYAHDWRAISKFLKLNFKKIHNSGYIVCHIPGKIDL